MTSSTSSPNIAVRAQTSPTNEIAASGPSPFAVSGSTCYSSIPLSLYSRYHIHSKENPLDLTLDDPFDLNNGIGARSSRAFRSRSGERKTNRVNPNPNKTLTLTLIPNRQRTEKNTTRSKDREEERGKGKGHGRRLAGARLTAIGSKSNPNPNRVNESSKRKERGLGTRSRTLTHEALTR